MTTRFKVKVNQDELWPATEQTPWLSAPREAFALWLARSLALRGLPQIRNTTLDTYDGIYLAWEAHLRSKQTSLFQANTDAVIDFFAKNTLAPNSQRRYLQLLERLYDHFCDQGWVPGNPFRLSACRVGALDVLELPPPDWLTAAELKALLAGLTTLQGWRGQRDRALAALLLGAGLRVSEARNLRLADIDTVSWRIKLTPGGVHKPHVTQLMADSPWQDWLQTWLCARTGIFPGHWVLCATAKGTAMSASAIFRRVDGWLGVAAISREHKQHGPNVLRNTFARTALSSGRFSTDEVQEFLGHHELRATLRHLPESLTAGEPYAS